MSTIPSKIYTKSELCLMEKIAEPCGIVIFGASGDLTQRKLIPSLFKLAQEKVLPPNYYILGAGRTALSDDAFRKKAPASFAEHLFYLAGDYADPKFYENLGKRLSDLDEKHKVAGRRVFYLSTPPELYETIISFLGSAKLSIPAKKDGWSRIVIEKPFGRDLKSATELNAMLLKVFSEKQIYRIDHYLGKETVQNIMMFRFANALFEPLWSRKYIDHVQITAAEAVGVEHRAGYYDHSGALRDMFQNHLFQLLCMVAMEPPTSLEAEAMRDEKSKVLASLAPLAHADFDSSAVRAQYTEYRKEPGVDPKSTAETFAALRLHVDNWRWQGVPFYLRSGKRMHERVTEIVIQFKQVPTSIFKPLLAEQLSANLLIFRIQPDEGISIRFETKHPGPKICMSTVTMGFSYQEAFKAPPPESYTRLFLDVILGDQTLFSRSDWLDRSWEFLTPLLRYWEKNGEDGLSFYPTGSWGPEESDRLINADRREWHNSHPEDGEYADHSG